MKVLVVIDMQNDFIDGALGSPEAQAIVPKIIDKMDSLDGQETILIFTKDTHYEDYLNTQEGVNLPVPHCKYMTSGWSINKEISARAKEGHFYSYSDEQIVNSRILKESFGSTVLANILFESMSHMDIDEIILVGVCTDICVISNAMILKSVLSETLITVDASCCAGVTPERHKNALQAMKSCQINVINE